MSAQMQNNTLSRFDQLLIPVQKVTRLGRVFRWPLRTVLTSEQIADSTGLKQLHSDLQKQLKIKSRITSNTCEWATLRISRIRNLKHPDAYRMTITQERIEIVAVTNAGAYYAIQTLRDLLTLYGRQIPACRIDDWPDFQRRGVYHDCSRGKVPKLETLKQLVERLAHWKINELQLYIENVFTFTRHPVIGKGYSPFNANEIIALQEHCKKHHVRLVGSLASFGHMEKILSLPDYQHLGEMPGFRGFPGGTTLCPGDPGSIKLVRELYEEFVPLFEATDFNVCCDETWELGKGRSRKRANKYGVGKVYLDFLLKIHRLCEKHGRRMNLWADIVLKHPELIGQLPRDIVLLNWEYESDGANIRRTKEIADAGIDFMVCPGTSSWLTHGSRLPNAMSNIRAFARQGKRHHAQGLLNTDWGDNGHRNLLGISLHGFAYGAAQAWSGHAVNDDAFTENFCRLSFGQTNHKLAKAIALLGSAYLTCGAAKPNRSLLFEGMFEPIIHSNPPAYSAIDMMTHDGLAKAAKELSSSNLFPAISGKLPEFEQIAMEELKLAAGMDALAAERAIAVKSIRQNRRVTTGCWGKLAEKLGYCSDEFGRLWRKRNKPSRLRDNLRLFSKTQQQMLRFADK